MYIQKLCYGKIIQVLIAVFCQNYYIFLVPIYFMHMLIVCIVNAKYKIDPSKAVV